MYCFVFLFKYTMLDIGAKLILICIILWGLRLAFYLFKRIITMGKDSRFDGRRENVVSFAMFWILQAVAIIIIMLPVLAIIENSTKFFIVTIFGLCLWGIGFIMEIIADKQKSDFKKYNKKKFISTGLWSLSRYPNYFGESLLWWGIFIACTPYFTLPYYATIISPIFITFLLLKVSGIPLLEESSTKKYGSDPAYQNYKKNTNLLFPFPKRKYKIGSEIFSTILKTMKKEACPKPILCFE